MKKHSKGSPPRLVALLFGAALFGLVSQSALAVQQGTASNTTISNMATLNYAVGGVNQTLIESSAAGNSTAGAGQGAATTFKVDKKVNVTVATTDAAAITVVPGQANVVTTFTVTNMGNDPQDFALAGANVAAGQVVLTKTDNFQTTGIAVYVESGATAGYQVGEDTATFIDELASGDSKTVYVLATMPLTQVNADAAAVSLTATARVGGSAGGGVGGALTETAGADTPGSVDIVFADGAGSDDASRDAANSARSAYVVVSSVISVQKTVAVICDPYNANVNPKNIPGAIVKYTVVISNSGAASATLSTVTDTLDANVAHDPGLRVPDGTPANCAAGAGTSGFKIVSSAGGRALGGTAGVMTNAADADGATIAGQNVTIDFSTALPAGGGYAAGELKTGESATVTYNAIIN